MYLPRVGVGCEKLTQFRKPIDAIVATISFGAGENDDPFELRLSVSSALALLACAMPEETYGDLGGSVATISETHPARRNSPQGAPNSSVSYTSGIRLLSFCSVSISRPSSSR